VVSLVVKKAKHFLQLGKNRLKKKIAQAKRKYFVQLGKNEKNVCKRETISTPQI